MFNKGLLIGGFNPAHYGHIALIETGLKQIEQLDIIVGNKSVYVLPRELRVRALNSVLEERKLIDRVRILDLKPKLREYDVSNYSAMLLGSDVLNHFPLNENIHRPQDRAFFSKFENLIVLQREGIPITNDARVHLKNSEQKLIEYLPVTDIAAKIIRSRYKLGVDVSEMMPSYVWEKIKPHAELFHSSRI